MFRFVLFSTLSHRAVALRPHPWRLARARVHLRRAVRKAGRFTAVAVQHLLLAPVIVATLLVYGAAGLVALALPAAK